jgi:hypothetical protein
MSNNWQATLAELSAGKRSKLRLRLSLVVYHSEMRMSPTKRLICLVSSPIYRHFEPLDWEFLTSVPPECKRKPCVPKSRTNLPICAAQRVWTSNGDHALLPLGGWNPHRRCLTPTCVRWEPQPGDCTAFTTRHTHHHNHIHQNNLQPTNHSSSVADAVRVAIGKNFFRHQTGRKFVFKVGFP